MFFPVFTIVFVPNLTLFYSPCFLFCIFNCFVARHVDNFFRHFPATEIFFSPRIWLFWFVASLCGRVETISIWLFSIFQFCLFFSVFVLFFFVAIPGILCSFWFASIRFFLYKIRYLCKCLPASRCLCFCRASILVFFFSISFSFFYFEGKSLKRRQAADILRICQVKVRVVCVFICISLFYCWLYLFLSATKCCIHLLHISAFVSFAFDIYT